MITDKVELSVMAKKQEHDEKNVEIFSDIRSKAMRQELEKKFIINHA
jgi:hypothetical protein